MAKSIDVSDLDIYYGDFLAVEGVYMTIKARTVTAFIGPSGCGKSTFLRSLNRMHEVIPGARVEGKIVSTASPSTARASTRSPYAARSAWSSSGPNPFPTMSIYDNVLAGNRLNNKQMKKAEADDDRRAVAASGANLWNEVKDRLEQAGHGPLRRPAAAAVHRPGHRRRAAGAADGRAVLGARPDLHLGDRGPDPRAEDRLHDRHRHPQHAAGRPGLRRHRLLQPQAAGEPGQLVEIDATKKIFSNPDKRRPRTTSPAASAELLPR